ncbi:acetylxylan esterase [Rariglobus hedericola]|uniref:Acetylxylan esterase n=1 Tax=Rariglobus hedericola TaxID=2597822 RepID=A0A556QSR0_9BACT|nr:acetylxylan esterase [Rariglobus hedericola]TSJ79649.1 acetylxylan esterase [Rariglobus hedericola]
MITLPRRFALRCLAPLFLVSQLWLSAAPVPTIVPDKAAGVYTPGETVSWTVNLKSEAGVPAPDLVYKIKKDGEVVVSEGKLDLSAGPVVLSSSRADAGVLIIQVMPPEKYALPLAVGGAIYAPDKIKPAAPEPADFDAFWKSKLAELAKVPVKPVLEKIPDAKNTAGVDYYKVTLDNIRGTKVRGQLARPSAEGKYPALLVVQFAGVYALDQNTVVSDAKSGWLTLNISAHDLPIDESPEFYKNLKDGALKNYIYIGSEDRETSYFLRMFLGCARAAEYLASRPDWDGKTLIVTGASQGGLQAFATAALSPKVTGLMAVVPAGCDNYAPRAGRAFGWPYWLSTWGPRDRDMKKVETTAGYFDGINFAARVKVPSLVAYGLADETSRPTGVAAAINVLKGTKEALILPLSNHHGTGGAQNAYFSRAAQWKKAVLTGKTLPPAAQ